MSWFSCRDYSERTSRKRDEPLGTRDRLGHAFHHLICYACRRFARQLRILDEAFVCVREELDQQSEERLSPEARQRIEKALHREHREH